eukprot:TRINITY_DN8998_c0_g3_i1.p2 TRINITY_DN8998_c0_g3~~TRINITY_DN8998_c0_g3_i1.p2  ORF type:complete len:109 (-),score=3.18 TRINITY_DN8998_c0_g3_i1:189-515(-)
MFCSMSHAANNASDTFCEEALYFFSSSKHSVAKGLSPDSLLTTPSGLSVASRLCSRSFSLSGTCASIFLMWDLSLSRRISAVTCRCDTSVINSLRVQIAVSEPCHHRS